MCGIAWSSSAGIPISNYTIVVLEFGGFLITGQFLNIGVSGNNVEKGPDARLLLEQMQIE